jgi:hypothetical protein
MGLGLQRVCKIYGGMVIQGERWVWDYARDIPVLASEMTKEQTVESDKVKARLIKAAIESEQQVSENRGRYGVGGALDG